MCGTQGAARVARWRRPPRRCGRRRSRSRTSPPAPATALLGLRRTPRLDGAEAADMSPAVVSRRLRWQGPPPDLVAGGSVPAPSASAAPQPPVTCVRGWRWSCRWPTPPRGPSSSGSGSAGGDGGSPSPGGRAASGQRHTPWEWIAARASLTAAAVPVVQRMTRLAGARGRGGATGDASSAAAALPLWPHCIAAVIRLAPKSLCPSLRQRRRLASGHRPLHRSDVIQHLPLTPQ